MKSGWAALVAAMLLPVPADAQTEGNVLAGIERIGLHTIDNVKNGCWPRPEQSSQEVELEFVRSTLSIDHSSPAFVTLSALGSETSLGDGTGSGSCVVSFALNLRDCVIYYPSYRPQARKFRCVTIWHSEANFVTPKTQAQRLLTDHFVEMARSFLLTLEKDQRGIAPE